MTAEGKIPERAGGLPPTRTGAEIIAAARAAGRTLLFEHEAKELLRTTGIIVPRFLVVTDPTDRQAIVAAGEALGFPVALKALSPDIVHKTEAGAVMLNIGAAAALAASLTTMQNSIASRRPGAAVQAFLVEKMMPQGFELLIGGLRDAQFGPAVSVGLGGVWVEALKDAAFGILPLDRKEMLAMLDATRVGLFLRGFRGSPPLDQEAVLAAISAVGRLLTDHAEIREIDLNPVRVYARSAAALDARVLLA